MRHNRATHNTIIDRHRSRKELGQFLLRNRDYSQRIASEVPPGALVIEIGAGDGSLTRELLDSGHRDVAVEIDQEMVRKIEHNFKHRRDFRLIKGNILTVDWNELTQKEEKIVITGNLPYHLTSPILFDIFQLIRSGKSGIESMVVMVQKEVAMRLTSEPNRKSYGGLTLLARYHGRTEYLLTVPADAFYPKPKVDGGVIRLSFHTPEEMPDVDYYMFRRIVRGCFAQRRKMMRNAIGVVGDLPEGWEELQYDFTLRPENFSFEDFMALTRDIVNLQSKTT